ncbi:hypothetical protein T439DRAFT_201817 [Meredithblackwellia eburnea MCA 4105]
MSNHYQVIQQIKKIIPPLSHALHKGQAGRIGILGGSKDYSGAPYFSSMATLRLGADLAHVICEPSAGNVIKTYSPDLIVHTDLSEDASPAQVKETLSALLPRLHVLVIGPGLGRSESMQSAARTAIALCREKNLYIVIDADGLWLIQNEPDVVKGYKKAVLTPNVVEFERLCERVGIDTKSASDPLSLAGRLASSLGGVTILQKGAQDRVTNGDETLVNEVEGSVRRCGGQGDVLSGLVGAFLAWGKSWEERKDSGDKGEPDLKSSQITLLASYAGSTITREASRITFARLKRSMQTNDMLCEIGPAFERVFGPSIPEGEEGEGRVPGSPGTGEGHQLRWPGRRRDSLI